MNRNALIGLGILAIIAIVVIAAVALSSDSEESDSNGDNDEPEGPFLVSVMLDTPVDDLALFEPVFIEPLAALFVEQGYVRGEDIEFEMLLTGLGTLEESGQRAIDNEADLVVAWGPATYQAFRDLNEDIPVITILQEVELEGGLREQIEADDSNETAVVFTSAHERRLDFLLQIVPDIEDLYILYNETDTAALDAIQDLVEARELNLIEASYTDIPGAVDVLGELPEEVDAIFTDQNALGAFTTLEDIVLERQMPLTFNSMPDFPGAIMSYGTEALDANAIVARLGDQILQGTDASSLPIEFIDPRLVIHLGTADAIGIEVPEDILRQADEIVEQPFTVEAEGEEGEDVVVAACNATLNSPAGAQQICVTASCDALVDAGPVSYTDQEEVDSCVTEEFVGVCETPALSTYYYDGDPEMLSGVCASQAGSWTVAEE